MPRSKKPIDDTKPQGANGVVFINFDIDRDMKKRLTEWRVKADGKLFELLDDLTSKSYSVSIKFDAFNECIGAFLTPKDPKSPNFGAVLTGRGSTSQSALMGVLFRHYAVFEENWPDHNHRTGNLDDVE